MIMKFIFFTLILFFSVVLMLNLTSCPQPLTEDDVVAALDELAPIITISTPGESSIYYSSVDFSLKIQDDAEAENDNKGDLSYISFDLSNDDFRGGRVDINTDGSLSQNPSYGPDEILYDSESGEVSFSFSTIQPNTISGLVSITVMAEDRNGNSSSEKITLTDNTGPWLNFSITDLSSGGDRSYTEDTTVRLSGTLGNSIENKVIADQVTSISWEVLGKSWNGILELDETATYVDVDTGETLLYYNSSSNRYERLNEGVAYPDLFIYNPSTRTFTTDIEIPFGAGSVLPFEIIVSDKNGHTTTDTINAFSDDSGPEVVIEPPTYSDDFYYSSGTGKGDIIQGYINGGISDLKSFKYQIIDTTGVYSTEKIDVSPGTAEDAFNSASEYNIATNEFYIDISTHFDDIVDNNDTTDITTDDVYFKDIGGSDLNVIIYAFNDDDFETRPKKLMIEDITGPVITINSFKSDYGDGSYANDDRTLTLEFTATDTVSAVSDLVPVVEIGNDSSPVTTLNGSFSSVSNNNWVEAGLSDDYLPYSIKVEDRLGNYNEIVQTPDDFPRVMYYSGNPVFADLNGIKNVQVSVSSSVGSANWAASGQAVDISVLSDRDLDIPLSLTLYGYSDTSVTRVSDTEFDASVTPTTLNIANADMLLNLTVKDKAGNTATLTSWDSGVNYDSLPPVAPSQPSLHLDDDTTLAGYGGGANDGTTKNNSELTVFGTAEADSLVSIFLDGSPTADFSVTATGGNWSGDLGGTLNHGSHTVVARTVDQAGNISADSPTFTLKVWTILPTDPLSIDLRTSDDSSRSGLAGGDADNITNITAINIDGVTDAGAYIVLYKDSVAESYTVADGLGNWTKLISLDSGDKTYSMEARAVDIAGNESSGSVIFEVERDTVNTNNPTIVLDSSDDEGYSDIDGITNKYSNLTFTGTMTDDDSYGVVLRGLHSDGSTAVSGLAGLSGNEVSGDWSVDADLISGTDEDTLTVFVISVDTAGNESSEQSMILIIDSTAPVLSAVDSIDLRSAYDSGVNNADNITNVSDPLVFDVNVSAFDANERRASDDNLYIEIFSSMESSFLDRTVVTSTGVKSLTTDRGLVEEGHTVSSRIYDLAGNPSASLPVSLPLEVDTTVPVNTDITSLTLTASSDTGYSDSDGFTRLTTPLTFSFSVDNYEEPGYMEMYSNENSTIRATKILSAGGAGQTITTTNGFSTEAHNISVKLYDTAGNERTGISGSCSIDVDNTAPNETISSFSLTAADDWGLSSSDGKTAKNASLKFDITVSSHTETLYLSLVSSLDSTIASYKNVDSWDSVVDSALSAGNHSITAYLYDVYGNEDDTDGPITVITDYTAPTGTLDSIDLNASDDTGFSDTDNVTNKNQIQFDFDLTGVNELSYVELTSDKESFSDLSSELAISTTSTSLTSTSGLSEYTHNFTAELFDIFGNSSGSTKILSNVVLDYTKPVTNISNLALDSSSDLGNPGDNKTAETGALTFSFDLTTAGFEDPSYILLESNRESPHEIQRALYSTGGTGKTISSDAGLIENSHTIKATVYDEAGNRSSGSYEDSFALTTEYDAPILAMTGMVKTGDETISSTTYDTLVIDLDEAHGSPVLAGTGIEGDFQDLAADINFDAHSSLSYLIKGKLQADGDLEIIQYDDSESTFVSFPTGDDFILNVGSSYTDEAGNRVRKSDNSKNLDSIQFDYQASITVDSQTGLYIPVSYNPYENEVEDETRSSRTRSNRSINRLKFEREVLPTPDDPIEDILTFRDDVFQLKQIPIEQPMVNIEEKQVLLNDPLHLQISSVRIPQIQRSFPDRERALFMAQVEENRLKQEAALDRLRHPPMSRARLEAMELLMTPEFPVVEELIVYTSPLPMAFEKPISLGKAEIEIVEVSSASYRYILLQAVLGVLILLLTAGFIWGIKRLQRSDR
ncbi:MAG: hypothetical protein B6241_01705 [Spirochaetaceae bacterium 4572_59]|nr:MAG: hypothetical protein B6241_01705 [Spirochaetaceae bacterium 4572_59]